MSKPSEAQSNFYAALCLVLLCVSTFGMGLAAVKQEVGLYLFQFVLAVLFAHRLLFNLKAFFRAKAPLELHQHFTAKPTTGVDRS